jgi:PTH1 family peptidyl-tRNA hydrolase
MTHFLLIGLGNPGASYAGNRHNVGFMQLAGIMHDYGFAKAQRKFGGLMAEGAVASHKVFAFFPQSFMNLSGGPAGEAAGFYKIPRERIIVVHDELDLPLGRLKVKTGGGHGGHNGLRSLDSHLGQDYRRVRFGIGHPGDKDRVSDYVLSDFAKDEWPAVEKLIAEVSRHLPLLLAGDDAGFMNRIALATQAPKEKKTEPPSPSTSNSGTQG